MAPVRPMVVNIQEAPGTQVSAEQSDDGISLNVIVEQVEGIMQGRMNRGTGLSNYMDSKYMRAR